MIQTFELMPGITLRCFPDDRFKQSALSVQFLRPMCREEAALNALLPAVLLRGCESCPDLRDITLRLDDLYGASVGALVRRVGDYHLLISLPLKVVSIVVLPSGLPITRMVFSPLTSKKLSSLYEAVTVAPAP